MTLSQERAERLKAAVDELNDAFDLAISQVDARSLMRILEGLSPEIRAFLPRRIDDALL